MPASAKFLVIDCHPDSRQLLVRTLMRKFAGATVHECDDADKAVEVVRATGLAAVVTHRTFEIAGVELVRRLREADPVIPIVMVSGIDQELAALAAGANAFLLYDEWLRVGSVVEETLTRASRSPEASSPEFA